jgi:hypothetical protein
MTTPPYPPQPEPPQPQIIMIPQAQNKIILIIAGICTGLILPLLVSVFTYSFSAPPHITVDAAHRFLEDYYTGIVDPNQAVTVYRDKLTSNFQRFPGHKWPEVQKFFNEQKHIDVDSVTPISGDPTKFRARITYYPRQGRKSSDIINFWLYCQDDSARIPIFGSCQPADLKIDNTERIKSTY